MPDVCLAWHVTCVPPPGPQVCPDSAKVRLNAGILARRHLDHTGALLHFRKAQALEPGYCEPDYWQGVTLINMGAARCISHCIYFPVPV